MSNLVVKEYNGITINTNDEGMVSMTDLWKASGKSDSQKPSNWNRFDGKEFISAVASKLKVSTAHLYKVTRGKLGATYAHPQIALSYAKYLNPELHMYVNQVFFERIEENANPDLALNRSIDRVTKGYERQGKSKEWTMLRIKSATATKANNEILAKHGQNKFVHSLCADSMNKAIIGTTAKKFKEANNLPKSAVVPDYLDEIQLAQYELTRLVAMKNIIGNDLYGNKVCADVHSKIATGIVGVCEDKAQLYPTTKQCDTVEVIR